MTCKSFLIVAIAFIGYLELYSCKTEAGSSKVPEKKRVPGTVSISPASFYCEAKVLYVDSDEIKLLLKKITARGSALFFPVADGDTIVAKNQVRTMNEQLKDSTCEMTIEERLKLNSDRQIGRAHL